jgi:hypothetical protein
MRHTVLVVLLTGALVAGCSGDKPTTSSASSPSTARTAAASKGPAATAKAGTVVKLGQPAVVRWHAGVAHDSLVAITVTGVKRGAIADLDQFALNRAAHTSNVYYVFVVVRNVGTGNLSKRHLSLYGKVTPHLVVPPVRFTLPFPRCDDRPLPAHFTRNARARVCLVMLAPRHGTISSVQWRSHRLPQPVSWRLR